MSAKTQHQRYRLHSQLNNSVIRNYAKMRAREPMLINVNEGIATGNVVRVFNDRGEILVGALVTDIIPEHVIAICEGAWYDPEVLGENSNSRQSHTSTTQSNCRHRVLANLEKYKGEIKLVTAFLNQKFCNLCRIYRNLALVLGQIKFSRKFSLNFQASCLHLVGAYQQELALSSRLLRRCHVCLCKDHACLVVQNPPPRQLNLASFAL